MLRSTRLIDLVNAMDPKLVAAAFGMLLLDLDNTLIDRDGAFRVAVTGFLQDHELPAADTGWLMRLDASGYAPRAEVARAISRRYGPAVSQRAVSALLDRGGADHVVLGDAAASHPFGHTGDPAALPTSRPRSWPRSR